MVSQLKALRTVKLENEDRRIKVFLAKEAQYRRGAHNILARYTRTHPLSPPSPSHPTPPSPLPLTPHPSPLTPHPSPPPLPSLSPLTPPSHLPTPLTPLTPTPTPHPSPTPPLLP